MNHIMNENAKLGNGLIILDFLINLIIIHT